MKRLIFSITLICAGVVANTQQKIDRNHVFSNPKKLEMKFMWTTEPVRNIPYDAAMDTIISKPNKKGYHPKKDWVLNQNINPNALPKNGDPALQKEYTPSNLYSKAAEIANWEGIITTTGPGDPAIDVGPNHVIQMLNGTSGAKVKMWDKSGNVVLTERTFRSMMGTPTGLGDPIVLYDERADRWMLSEFCSGCNDLFIAISETGDPTGSYHVFTVSSENSFPDYPKYAIWDNSFVMTSNESNATVYIMDRTKMLAGTANTVRAFDLTNFGTIGFQTATPVSMLGTVTSGSPAMIMRMRDDAWTGAATDALEIWELDVDWNVSNGAGATMSQTQVLGIQPHESELCGYTSFSCIPQPGGNDLDPLRELLMNRIMYRNFGSHESMVCAHVTDVDGNDLAGIRWYELRRTGGSGSSWTMYQQGTYAPNDGLNRWMPTIGLSASGNIGLAYNVSSTTTHPEIRYTGRKECDALNMMTEAEVQLVDGTSNNNVNRWGDYNAMGVDPTDGETFWFVAQYNPATQARTRIGAFKIDQCSATVKFSASEYSLNESDANVANGCNDYYVLNVPISVSAEPSATANVTVNVTGGSATLGLDYDIFNTTFAFSGTTLSGNVEIRVYNDSYVEGDETITLDYTLNANGGDAAPGTLNQTVTVTINDDDLLPANMTAMQTLIDEDFEGGFNGFTTVNASGATPFQIGNNAAASTTAYAIPTANTTQFAWLNDDDCNCNQNQVDLIFPTLDLSQATSLNVSFDTYFESNTYQGDTETALFMVSINNGAFVSLGSLTASVIDDSWVTQNFNADSYVGNVNVRFAVRYSDAGGWLYGLTVDNVVVTGEVPPVDVQQGVNTGSSMTANVGPSSEVHFTNPSTGHVIMTLNNSSAHDFGCVTVEVDRAGTASTQFSTANTSDYLMDKTFKITPTNPSNTSTIEATLFYKEAEVAGWESATGNARANAEMIKVDGTNTIGAVNPGNAGGFAIENEATTLGVFNSDVTFTASFSTRVSGLGIGIFPSTPGAPTANFSASSTIECQDECITFTDASSTPSGTITSWDWDFGNGSTSTDQNPNAVCYSAPGTYTIMLTVDNGSSTDNFSSTIEILAESASTQDVALCPGESVTVGTSTYNSAGNFQDVLTNDVGCDSTITTNVTMLSPSSFDQTLTICEGQSVTVGTSTYSTADTYVDMFTNDAGCDSTVNTTLVVNPNPIVVIDNASSIETICLTASTVTLSGTPVGGSFTGNGVSGTNFDPSSAGAGTHTVTYDYTDVNGCDGTETISVEVLTCVGIEDGALENVLLYPNPNTGTFIITGLEDKATYSVYDATGKLVLATNTNKDSNQIIIPDAKNGIYFLHVTKQGETGVIQFSVIRH